MPRHRGRKSAAELAVVPMSAVQRPEPPEELSAEEAEVWRLTVEGMRADWFGVETHPLLRCYCTQAATAELLARALRTTHMGDKSYGRLLALHRGASKIMFSLATKLRITPQSNRMSSRDGRDPTGGHPKPWENGDFLGATRVRGSARPLRRHRDTNAHGPDRADRGNRNPQLVDVLLDEDK
jgi:hypothetical protein